MKLGEILLYMWIRFALSKKIKMKTDNMSRLRACPVFISRPSNIVLRWESYKSANVVDKDGNDRITCYIFARVCCSYLFAQIVETDTIREYNEYINAFNMCWKWYRIRGWPPREKAYVRRLFYTSLQETNVKRSQRSCREAEYDNGYHSHGAWDIKRWWRVGTKKKKKKLMAQKYEGIHRNNMW